MNDAFSAASTRKAQPAPVINRTNGGAYFGEAVMTRVSKFSMVAIALFTLGTSVTSASAETFWQFNHPRRAQVNERLGFQNYRINQGVADGRINPYRAQQLRSEDYAIRNEERTMAGINGGYITPAQQRALNQQENVVSRRIGW
jgi:hypothetical protein